MTRQEIGVTGYLEVGDTIIMHTALFKDQKYIVTEIEGNKVYTKSLTSTFGRKFNRKIYWGKRVYEYGKRLSPVYNPGFEVIKIQPGSSPDSA